MGFHGEGKGSEGGSVRRFRMEVGGGKAGVEGGDEDGGDGDGGEDDGVRRPWWKFGKGKGKGKGKEKGVSAAEGGIGSYRDE